MAPLSLVVPSPRTPRSVRGQPRFGMRGAWISSMGDAGTAAVPRPGEAGVGGERTASRAPAQETAESNVPTTIVILGTVFMAVRSTFPARSNQDISLILRKKSER